MANSTSQRSYRDNCVPKQSLGTRIRTRSKTILNAPFSILAASLVAALFAHLALSAEPNKPDAGKQASGYVDVPGSKLYYEECGSGPAIVLLHDGLLDAVSWDEVWQPLATKYHVIRYDRRGYGRSDPVTTPFSPTGDLTRLLTHLKVQHALIVGSSSGGALAIDFAIEYPQMVDRLLLIGPVLHRKELA